jgi:hypothetical protein
VPEVIEFVLVISGKLCAPPILKANLLRRLWARAEIVESVVTYSARGLWPCQVGAVGSLAVNPDIYIARGGLVPPPRVVVAKPTAKTDVRKQMPVVAHTQGGMDKYAAILPLDFLGPE